MLLRGRDYNYLAVANLAFCRVQYWWLRGIKKDREPSGNRPWQPSGAPTQLNGLRCLLHALPHCLCIQTGQRDPSIKVFAGLCQEAPRRIRECGVSRCKSSIASVRTATASRRTPSACNTDALRRVSLPTAIHRDVRGVGVSAGLRAQRGGARAGRHPIEISLCLTPIGMRLPSFFVMSDTYRSIM
jgi:hypothetical protein